MIIRLSQGGEVYAKGLCGVKKERVVSPRGLCHLGNQALGQQKYDQD